jgi:hypothetical protein
MPPRQPGGWARRAGLTHPCAFQMQGSARLAVHATLEEEPEFEMAPVWAVTPPCSARSAARKAEPREAAPRPRELVAVAA